MLSGEPSRNINKHCELANGKFLPSNHMFWKHILTPSNPTLVKGYLKKRSSILKDATMLVYTNGLRVAYENSHPTIKFDLRKIGDGVFALDDGGEFTTFIASE